jgi:hypothetical protein
LCEEIFTSPSQFYPGDVSFVPFPQFSFKQNTFFKVASASILQVVFVILFLLMVFMAHSGLLMEKETKMREMLKIMGVTSGALVASSFLFHIFIDLVLSFILAFLSRSLIYSNTSFGILFGLYFFFIMSLMSWAHFVTAFFSKSMTGSMFGTLTLFAGWFIVGGGAIKATTPLYVIRSVCLMPAAALSLGITLIAQYETFNLGLSMSSIAAVQSTEYGTFDFQTVLGMLVFDSFSTRSWDGIWTKHIRRSLVRENHCGSCVCHRSGFRVLVLKQKMLRLSSSRSSLS